MLASLFFFFIATATTEIYTLSLHDALPITGMVRDDYGLAVASASVRLMQFRTVNGERTLTSQRSEEHKSELQSLTNLVCRLLLVKKKQFRRDYNREFPGFQPISCQEVLHVV